MFAGQLTNSGRSYVWFEGCGAQADGRPAWMKDLAQHELAEIDSARGGWDFTFSKPLSEGRAQQIAAKYERHSPKTGIL
jgi:hypothetical protein